MAWPAARRRHSWACVPCACTASSDAWLCPPLDVGTSVHAPRAHAQRRAVRGPARRSTPALLCMRLVRMHSVERR
eukprot:6014386-Pleurochrysis_carterae.AAC.1